MLKRVFLVLATVVVCGLSSADALAAGPMQAGSLGIGLGSGTWVSGLSARYNLTRQTAVQAHVGNYGAYGVSTLGLSLSADFIAYRGVLKKTGAVTVGYNAGVGAGLGIFANVTHIRAAGVAGVEFNLNKFPLDIVLEARPSLSIVPGVGGFVIHLTGQIRYYI